MASPDSKIRDRAVRTVQTFLGSKGDSLNYDEFLKLWKGFFYCFWLSDKTDGQFTLAELIAKLVHNLPVEKEDGFAESGAALFLRSFWETMGREWPRLDRLRLNKYYSLMKHVLHQSFQMIAIASETEESSSWDSEYVKGHTSILLGTVFDYSNRAYPESIRNYVIENYFELLKSCAAEPFSAEMTVLVCEPMIHAVAYCENKAFFKQASEALIQGLLPGDNEGDDLEENMNSDEENEGQDSNSEEESVEELEEVEEEEEREEEEEVDSEEFDSEEYDNIKECDEENECFDHEEENECCDHEENDCCDDLSNDDASDEEDQFVFDYSLLAKFIFDFGAREDVLVRNRRFLYELSQIIEQVATGTFESCCNESCEDDACRN